MYQTFEELGFKVGDKVKCLKEKSAGIYKAGKVYELVQGTYELVEKDGCANGYSADWEKVEDMFEDQWHLNDGKVEIPADADKLEKDGSVVAFRKRKEQPLKFGDDLVSKISGSKFKFISYKNNNPASKLISVLHEDGHISGGCNPDNFLKV